jgi:predicted ATPase/DNA-binding winged helix-turn-helix (wHTH) protein
MLRFGCFQLDPIQGLRRGNEEVRVTPKSLSVLLLLVERAGEIVTKDEIFRAVWRDTAVSDSALTSCIQELRHVLRDDARLPRFVETLHRRGYRFVARVSLEEKNSPSVVSLPQATDNGPFVGRETAIQEMLRIWANVERGSRQMLFVTGEAGIGKTTIISGFLRNIPAHNRTWGQCIQHFGFGEPYEPLLDGLTRLYRQSGGAKVVSAIERYGPTWLAQLPALLTPERYAALRRNVAGTTRERMFRELTDVMEAITHEVPLIFCLEDLHWSDPSTVEWIAAFAQRPEASRLLLIGTFRPSEVAETNHPLEAIFRELKAKRFCHEIALHGLDESSIAKYVRVRFRWAVGQEGNAAQLVPLLHAQTDGNPLFVINVLGDLVDRHLLLESNGYWQLRSPLTRQDLGIPEDIRRVIDQQIGRLTASELALLEVASVTGLTFSLSLVASVAGVSESSADEILASLCRQLRFIRRIAALDGSKQSASAQFEFIHVLYRDTLYQRISPIRLRDLHCTIGICEELALGEQASSVAAELAMHFECADDTSRALFYLEKAAQNARHRSAFTEARNFFDRALKLLKRQAPGLERTERQAVLLTGLGGVIMATQGWGASEAEEAYSQAWALRQNLGENPKLFSALWGLWLFYWGRGSLDIANEAVADLLIRGRQADDSALLLQAHHAGWATAFSRGDLETTMQHTEEGLRLYEADKHAGTAFDFGNHDAGVCCRLFRARTLALLGRTDEATRACGDAIGYARSLSHPFSEALALVFASSVDQVLRDPMAAKAHASAAAAIAREQGFKLMLAWATAFEGWAETQNGMADEGLLRIATNVSAAKAIGSNQFQSHLLGLLAEAHLTNGRNEAGLQVIDKALEAVQGGERFYEAELRRLQGELHLAQNSHSTSEPEKCFLLSHKIATCQKANLFAFRTAVSLGRLWRQLGRQDEAHRVVVEARNQISGILPPRDLADLNSLLSG